MKSAFLREKGPSFDFPHLDTPAPRKQHLTEYSEHLKEPFDRKELAQLTGQYIFQTLD